MEIYFSPYRLFENTRYPNLRYEKSRIVERFEHSGASTIHVDDIELTKDDILTLFESLEDSNYARYHQLIFDNKALLGFLENRSDSFDQLITGLRWSNMDVGLKNFLMPYFINSYAQYLESAFISDNTQLMKELYELVNFIPPGEQEQAFRGLEQKIDQLIAALKSIIEKIQSKNQIDDDKHAYLASFFSRFNHLPEYFKEKLDGFYASIANLASSYVGMQQYAMAKDLYVRLKEVNCPQKLKEQIELDLDNLSPSIQSKTRTTNYKPRETSSKKNKLPLRIAIVSIPVAVIVILLLQRTGPKPIDIQEGTQEFVRIAQMSSSIKPYYQKLKGSNKVVYCYAEKYKEALRQVPEKDIIRRNIKRSMPYNRLFGANEFTDTKSLPIAGVEFLRLNNKSEYDMVLFFVRSKGMITAHSYIYAGDSKTLEFSPLYRGKAKEYKVYAYVGVDWSDFYRYKINDKLGLKGMFEFQPGCLTGIQLTNLKVSCSPLNGAKMMKNNIIDINNEKGDCPLSFAQRDTIVNIPEESQDYYQSKQ